MHFLSITSQFLLAAGVALGSSVLENDLDARAAPAVITPRVVIISMFGPEGGVWFNIPDFDLSAQNITIPGLSPLYPQVHCTKVGHVCQLILGESEINAASSVTALVQSGRFDFTLTYFMIAGIAGVNPEVATLGSVTFARYAVQVALQYEFDAREIPANFSTGYVPQGATHPGEYPQDIYGTEVFEVNDNLRKLAIDFAKKATLADNKIAQAYRKHYATTPAYKAGSKPPSIVACDVATSDVYYSGALLSEAFGRYTKLITNGTGVYGTTAQEDNATLEAMVRAALFKKVDFSRIIVMRTCSDFDRPYKGEADTVNLFYANQGGFPPSIKNIYRAGRMVVNGILAEWESKYKAGIKPDNYIGDILGSLGGTPDFGLPSFFINGAASTNGKRMTKNLRARMAEAAMEA